MEESFVNHVLKCVAEAAGKSYFAEEYAKDAFRNVVGAPRNVHLSKPFDINKLMEVLTSLLDLDYTENENVQ